MKKILLIIICLFCLTGCNSYIELNDLAIINAIGIEKNNDKWHLLVTLIEGYDDKSLEPTTTLEEIEGNNLLELIDDLSYKLSKKIYMSHLELLIINESVKQQELETIINYFLNNNETREDFLVVQTNNLKTILEKTKFQEINNLIKNNERETSKTIYTTMYDVINNFFQKTNIYFPYLEFNEKVTLEGIKTYTNNNYQTIKNDDVIYLNYLLNNIDTYHFNYQCSPNKYLYINILDSKTIKTSNNYLINNELKVITNDCNLKKNEIDNIFQTNLQENLKKITKQNITIKNTIRGTYEN